MAKQWLLPDGYIGRGCVGQPQRAWRRCIRRWREAVGLKVVPQHLVVPMLSSLWAAKSLREQQVTKG